MRSSRSSLPWSCSSLSLELSLEGPSPGANSARTNQCALLASSKSNSTSESIDYAYGSQLCLIAAPALSIPGRPAGAGRTQRYASLPEHVAATLRFALLASGSHNGVADERAFGPTMRGAGAVCDSAETFRANQIYGRSHELELHRTGSFIALRLAETRGEARRAESLKSPTKALSISS